MYYYMELADILDKTYQMYGNMVLQISENHDKTIKNESIFTPSNLCDKYNAIIRRLQKEIFCIYEEYQNIDPINNIYEKDEILKELNIDNKQIFRWKRSILFVSFNTKPYRLIVQIQDKHPFVNTISYLYKPQDIINNIYFNCIKSHLNGSHEDVIHNIISFLPKNRFIEAKLYLLKYKYTNLADNYHCIESMNNWSPVFNSSGMHILLRKYLEILTWVGIDFNKCI